MAACDRTKNDDIVKIEQCVNILMRKERERTDTTSYKVAAACTREKLQQVDIAQVKELMRGMCRREDLAFLDTHLRKRGYVRDKGKNAGEIHYARFRDEADITQSVWSRYETGTQTRTDHDTLLKIILALRLNAAEAQHYLSLAGSGFAVATDMVDRIILSYIMCDYLGDTDTIAIVGRVKFILDFYSDQEVSAGKKALRSLYRL